MEPPTREECAAVARMSGHPLPAADLAAAMDSLAEVLEVAERLDELDLDGVEPLFRAP